MREHDTICSSYLLELSNCLPKDEDKCCHDWLLQSSSQAPQDSSQEGAGWWDHGSCPRHWGLQGGIWQSSLVRLWCHWESQSPCSQGTFAGVVCTDRWDCVQALWWTHCIEALVGHQRRKEDTRGLKHYRDVGEESGKKLLTLHKTINNENNKFE